MTVMKLTVQQVLHVTVSDFRRDAHMGKLLFGMVQSLDGYIAGTPGGPQLPPPGPELHRHFNDKR
jgi:hypothetical protein